MQNKDIKIYISCHKPSFLPKGPYFYPIQAGTALSSERFPGMLHDDTGDNISDRNKRYCELTAQYWAWKNDTADYVGFCHYRRYFSFLPKRLDGSSAEVRRGALNSDVCAELSLNNPRRIRQAVSKADIFLTDPMCFETIGIKNLYSQFGEYSQDLHLEDLLTAVKILKEMYPAFSDAADTYLEGTRLYPCNMFIMKRSIFERYCQWLFPILDETDRQLDYTGYSPYAMRTIGHISERLLGIFCTYIRQNEPECRFGCLQRIYMEMTDSSEVKLREKQRIPVYGLHTANGRKRLLTISEQEKAVLESGGWLCEGVVQYAAGYGTPVYRLFNPKAWRFCYQFTASKSKIKILTALGWQSEGPAWYNAKA